MVVQERGSSRYQLGPAVLRLGNVYLDTLELRSKAIPWAEDLARRTGLRGAHRRPAPRRRRDHPPRATTRRQPADARGRHRHPGARERAGQGHARVPARGRASACCRRGTLRSMTGETLTAAEELDAQLDAVRSSGVAVESGRGGARRVRAGQPACSTRQGRWRARSASSSRPARGPSTTALGTRSARRRGPSPASSGRRRGPRRSDGRDQVPGRTGRRTPRPMHGGS